MLHIPQYAYPRRLLPGHIRLLERSNLPEKRRVRDFWDTFPDYEVGTSKTPEQETMLYSFNLREIPLESIGDVIGSYCALSYVWNEWTTYGEPNYHILIDGCIFQVTPNLYRALEHMYEKELENPFWIDAICIRQDDEIEKGGQIKLMPAIYSGANHVVAWLGCSNKYRTENLEDALNQADKLGARAASSGILQLSKEELLSWSTLDVSHRTKACVEEIFTSLSADFARDKNVARLIFDKLRPLNQHQRSGFPISAFFDLLNLPYFSRVWIIQECLLAPEGGLTFAFQQARASFNHLVACYELLMLWNRILQSNLPAIEGKFSTVKSIYKLIRQDTHSGSIMHVDVPRAASMFNWRRWYLRDQSSLNLKTLLKMAYVIGGGIGDGGVSAIECTRAEDRVYAIVGITQDFTFLGEDSEYYGRRLEAIYQMVAVHLISQGHIDILSLCQPKDPSFPSWVPDWRQQLEMPWHRFHEDNIYSSSGHRKVHLTENPQFQSIKLHAWHVDAIQDIGQVWNFSRKASTWIMTRALIGNLFGFGLSLWRHDASHFINTIKTFLQTSRYNPNDRQDAVWKIPIAERASSRVTKEALAVGYDSFKSYDESTKSFLRSNAFVIKAEAVAYLDLMWRMMGNRPFLTQEGYVGLCPEEALPGDELYIISGAQVPYLVRPIGNESHRLIGPAYVYGIMHGEFFDNSVSDDMAQGLTLS